MNETVGVYTCWEFLYATTKFNGDIHSTRLRNDVNLYSSVNFSIVDRSGPKFSGRRTLQFASISPTNSISLGVVKNAPPIIARIM